MNFDPVPLKGALVRHLPQPLLDWLLRANRLSGLSKAIILLFLVIMGLVASIVITAAYTRIRYRYQMYRFSTNKSIMSPPNIPYNLPFLGNALEMFTPKPGQFWEKLFSNHPRETGACTLVLGGMTTHIIYDPTAVQALFKSKGATRDRFNHEVTANGLNLPRSEVSKFYGLNQSPQLDEKGKDIGPVHLQEQIWQEFLLKNDAVKELTAEFLEQLETQIQEDECLDGGKVLEIGIVEWLRPLMFKSSTTALLGSRLLEVYPEFTTDFWEFSNSFFLLVLGLPAFITPKSYQFQQKALEGMRKWQRSTWKECDGKIEDPHGPIAWEPIYGSRVSRRRQELYRELGLNPETGSALDLGTMFALGANAIPTAGWMLLHILDPNGDPTLMPRLLKEVKTARESDGTLDVLTLITLPLLQATFHEAMRLYTDFTITRDITQDLVLPFNEGKTTMKFRKGDVLMAPSFPGHLDEALWSTPEAPSKSFHPERFLKKDPESEDIMFSLTGTAGKFFPFGGGKTMCPGRVFAKQEVLAAVAMTLLQLDIEPVGYVDLEGRPATKFPGLKDEFGGLGIVSMNGDMKVKIKRRNPNV